MSAPVHAWLAEKLPAKVRDAIDRIARAPGVTHVAIMPDVHLAEEVCVGTVIATTRLIYPAAVGGDIGCGMAAVAIDAESSLLHDERRGRELLSRLRDAIPGIRRRRALPLPAGLATTPLSHPSLESIGRRDGRVEFATLGRGNHFLEFQADEHDRLWMMVHSGSRAMGPAARDLHLCPATMILDHAAKLRALDATTPAGQAYLHDMSWCRAYAAASRWAMLQEAAGVMRSLFAAEADWSSCFDCDHNHIAPEEHFGGLLYVHRKGASAAAEGHSGIIPGSMGTRSFHTVGRGEPMSLRSSSHGAGRAMSRGEARRKIDARMLGHQMRGVVFDARHADSLREEAPAAYKDIGAVMRAQRELTRIVRTLRPLLVYKAG